MKAESCQRRNHGKRKHWGYALRITRFLRNDSVIFRVVDQLAERARNVEITLTEKDLTECLNAIRARKTK